MKPRKPGSPRKRIILYYFTGVVLPGMILGYMAFRGIRNDQALREKDNLDKLEASSQIFFSEIDSDLESFTDKVASNPSILIHFIKDSTGSKRMITHQLLYLPAEFLPDEPGLINPPSSLKEGERLEFEEQRIPDALTYYQEKIRKTNHAEGKREAMVASARLYKKMNQLIKAKVVYEQIRKDYKGSLLKGQIPVALMSGLEIMKINRALEEESELQINLQKSLELLLHPECDYDANQFEMFFQSFKEMNTEPDDIIDSLFTKLETKGAMTKYLIWFLGEPNLLTASANNPYESSRNKTYSIPVISGELQAMYLTRDNNSGMQSGMVIDFPIYMRSIAEQLLSKIDPGSSLNAKIENSNGDLVHTRMMTEETGYHTYPFPEHFPAWNLLLSENRPGFMSTLMKAGSGIYLFAFILIVLLMLLGFVFILYTLQVELRLNRLKSEFISNVSHELKSPLTSIRMMTELLHHNRVENEERKIEYYAAMLEESDHLSHLIDNILDFSRIEEDRKKYEIIDLDPDKLTREFLKSIRETIRETGFEISYTSSKKVPVIRADRNAILQVLYNLVDNAIKYSGTSKKVDVNLDSGEKEIQLSVKDYGIGISIKDQENIFERFYRCRESQQAGIRGSGIGLTIVKKIVEDHGGHLTVDSKPGEGSMFIVHLPREKTTEPQSV